MSFPRHRLSKYQSIMGKRKEKRKKKTPKKPKHSCPQLPRKKTPSKTKTRNKTKMERQMENSKLIKNNQKTSPQKPKQQTKQNQAQNWQEWIANLQGLVSKKVTWMSRGSSYKNLEGKNQLKICTIFFPFYFLCFGPINSKEASHLYMKSTLLNIHKCWQNVFFLLFSFLLIIRSNGNRL